LKAISKVGKLLLVAAIAIALEVLLRLGWGLGKRPLYIADREIGYLLAPNQRLRRFGNRFVINQYSQRSEPIEPERPPTTRRILLLGDSIANGAWWTDQQQTISALMAAQLATPGFSQVQVLNASANSWGPRNQLAYLKHYGTFQSQAIVLLLNTDDLFATAATSLPVGRDSNYPERQPAFALAELFARAFYRLQPIPEMAAVLAESGDRVGLNLQAISQMRQIVRQGKTQFLLAITPLRRQVDGTPPREYEVKARARLQDFAASEGIVYLDFLPIFQQWEPAESLYRDHIHLSPEGNRLVSEKLSESLTMLLQDLE
jgi:hypothetical protein